MDHLTDSMKEIKKVVRLWEKRKIWETNDRIRNIQVEKARTLFDIEEGRQAGDYWERLKVLEEELKTYLFRKEMTWRLKSRAIWLDAGDQNTKFFHKYASGRRRENTIWCIEDSDKTVHTTEEIKRAAVKYFGALYNRREM